MELTLTQIPMKDILYFMGYGDHIPDVDELTHIEVLKDRLIKLATPRFVYREFPLQEGQPLGANLTLEGDDIQRLLKDSHHCILLAVTLGVGVEKELRRLQIKDMAEALIFDSCASAAIEQICDMLQADLEAQYQQQESYLTDRYSCGYGDLPLQIQNAFLTTLDAQRKIGLHVNESFMLVPMKSVTAILGIADIIQPAILRGCDYCSLKETCQLRKRGNSCGK